MFSLKKFGYRCTNVRSSFIKLKSDLLPRQTIKIYSPNPSKQKYVPLNSNKVPCAEVKTGPRVNLMNIQMLSKAMYQQIFKEDISISYKKKFIQTCRKSLEKHGITLKSDNYVRDVNFKLPPIEGKNLIEHFEIIGERQAKPYRDIITDLLTNLPKAPIKWLMQEGWTRYEPNQIPEKVPYPLEQGLVFDVEVCMQAGKAPTLATAVSNKAWYGWVSQSLLDGTYKPVTSYEYSEDCLIPLDGSLGKNIFEKNIPKVVVGHNVSYDRARIKEQYWLEQTGTRFIDTMSLHICVSGITSYQRTALKSKTENEEDDFWKSSSSLNSLSAVHNLYCGSEIEKERRNLFVEGTLLDIQTAFQDVMSYCSKDVEATYNVLKHLFPIFLERFPHPVTFAGMLEMSTAYLPVNSNWSRYIADSEQTYADFDMEGRILLARRADEACQLLHQEKYKEDIWMWDQDWKVKDLKLLKKYTKKKEVVEKINIEVAKEHDSKHESEEDELKKKFSYLEETRQLVSKVNTHLVGYPSWYRKLCTKPDSSPDWVPGPHLIGTSMQVTPKLLNLTWEGYPLHYIRGLGWGFLIPFSSDLDQQRNIPLKQLLEKCPLIINKLGTFSSESIISISKVVEDNLARKDYYKKLRVDKTDGIYKGSGVWCNTILEDCCFFFKLPHKDGAAYNVGNPLAKDYLNKFSENVLAGDTESAETVLSIARKMSYWRNNRYRIMEQMVVWLNSTNFPKKTGNVENSIGAIIPQVVVCGTLTRRAVEPTWMTASNANPERIGSELRALIQAPPGYNIVGADVDSQELWIASVIGDAHLAKMHGATPLGWMTLSGSKSDGTDMHSVTAKAVGISRDHAKIMNYARIYGAGQNFAERLLKQFNPSMSEGEARSKAVKMFNLTKGKLVYNLRPEYVIDLSDQPYNKWQAIELAKTYGKSIKEIFYKPKWVDGTESAMFNRLEEIADALKPVTPFLGGRLSRALEPQSETDDRFLPTRINWVVQSGAVDFLHLMLVCMRWILKDKARFCLSFHDEVRYLVPEEYKYQAALAMHVTNLLTRAFCSLKLGLNDLPQSIAFFSSVEVDTVLRKESQHDCKTPSNPHGLEKGYGIKNGESLNIYEAIEKAGGEFSCWYQNERFRCYLNVCFFTMLNIILFQKCPK